jgi:predicted ATPase
MHADALLRHRRIQEALSILADALTTASATGVRPHLAELHRLHGAALLQSGASAKEAETSFQHAVDVAQEQRGRSLELRAAMSLARLWRDQGKVQQARELLAPVYGGLAQASNAGCIGASGRAPTTRVGRTMWRR